MATAAYDSRRIPQPAKMVPQPDKIVDEVVLKLSREEAQFLADVTACISGDPEKSRRRHAVSLSDALRSIGMKFKYPVVGKTIGSLCFEDEAPCTAFSDNAHDVARAHPAGTRPF